MYFDNNYAVPAGWQKLSIGQICKKFTSGGTPSRKNLDFYINGTIPWVKTKELNDGYIADVEEFITEEALSNSSAKKLPKDTVLMAMYGATVGKLGILPFDAACNQACAAMVVDEGFSDFKFLFYLLKNWRSEIISQATGAAQQNLSGELVRNFEFDFPPVEIQNAIGELLGTLDEKIRVNQQIASTLEQIAQTVFKSWFLDFDPVHAKARGAQPVGMNAETAALFPDSIEESELGNIPKGWKVGTISNLCSRIANGSTPLRSNQSFWEGGDIPWFKTGELDDGYVLTSGERITSMGLDNSSCKIFPANTVLIALYGATIGRLGIISNDAAFNQACCAMIAKDEVGLPFLFLSLFSRKLLFVNSGMGAAQQNISKEIVENCPLVIPTEKVLLEFDDLMAPIFEKLKSIRFENQALGELRDSLLPRLISGELEIPAELLEA